MLGLLCSVALAGPHSFLENQVALDQDRVEALEAGDVDHDGIDDLIGTINNDSNRDSFVLLSGTGAGMASPAYYDTGRSIWNGSVLELADLNEDGRLDVVLGDDDGVAVYSWSGSGFTLLGHFGSFGVGGAGDLAVADLDGDGHLDVVAQEWNGSDPVIGWGDGTGGFAGETQLDAGFNVSYALATPDLDGDGRAELAVVAFDYVGRRILIYEETVPRQLTLSPRSFIAGNGISGGLESADLDGDGADELLYAQGISYSGIIDVYSLEQGVMVLRQWVDGGAPGNGLVVGDIDMDGWTDVAIAHPGYLSQTHWLNEGGALPDVGITVWVPGGSGVGIDGTALVDMTGDDCPELFFAESTTSVWMLQGAGCGDLDGDQDDDGVPDGYDSCPEDENRGQENSDGDREGDACDECPDQYESGDDVDGDGLGDECDWCPDDPGGYYKDDPDNDSVPSDCDPCPNVYSTRVITPDSDTDDDGVHDGCDLCVGTADPDQLDRDGDGIGDACDRCPDEPGQGCPQPDEPGGCGCANTGQPAEVWVVLLLAALGWRRR